MDVHMSQAGQRGYPRRLGLVHDRVHSPPKHFSTKIVLNEMICYRTFLHGINYGGTP
jgi:hypothetical protein